MLILGISGRLKLCSRWKAAWTDCCSEMNCFLGRYVIIFYQDYFPLRLSDLFTSRIPGLLFHRLVFQSPAERCSTFKESRELSHAVAGNHCFDLLEGTTYRQGQPLL